MAEQKLLLGNVRGEQGPAGPNLVSASTTTSGFENGHLLYNNNGHVGAKSFLDLVYPVGSIYEWSSSGISGAPDLSTVEKVKAYFGGAWEEYGKGRVLVCVDSGQSEFDSVGKTGGETKHALTGEENGQHAHEYAVDTNTTYGGQPGYDFFKVADSGKAYTKNSGTGQPHNNLQPYITVYRYRRIA